MPSGRDSYQDAEVLIVEDLAQQRLPARQVAAVLGRAGVSVSLAPLRSMADVAETVALAQVLSPRLIVCSLLFADRAAEFELFLQTLARAGISTHRTLIGHLPSLVPSAFLEAWPALDSVLCGEPEANIVQFATAVKTGRIDLVPGLIKRENANGSERPARRATLADLDALAFPSHPEAIPTRRGYGFVTIKASRGCYHHCTFCLPAAFYRRYGPCYRQRSIMNIVDEIEQLYGSGARL
ncbi:MAG: B12-binding domain-containing radical SAM protein, partial [Rudaea sp.]